MKAMTLVDSFTFQCKFAIFKYIFNCVSPSKQWLHSYEDHGIWVSQPSSFSLYGNIAHRLSYSLAPMKTKSAIKINTGHIVCHQIGDC